MSARENPRCVQCHSTAGHGERVGLGGPATVEHAAGGIHPEIPSR